MIQITYDTKENYDVEYSFWKRMYVEGNYETVSKMFEDKFPELKAFSYDEVKIKIEYVVQS